MKNKAIKNLMLKLPVAFRIAFTLLFSICLTLSTASAETVVAIIGKDLKVTQDDVDALAAFFKARHFESSQEGYKQAAVKLRLFSMEAKALGLDEDIEGLEKLEADSIAYMNELQKRYNLYLLETYPVKDKVIESYYWAHPDYFFDKENHDEKQFPEPELLPLTQELKEKIREKVIFGQKEDITQKAYKKLMEKYNVQICESGKGCK